MNNYGTPNQKAVYSTLGIVLEKALETLLSDKISTEEKEIVYKGVDSVCKITSEMTKAYATEIIRGKVACDKIRNIESKVFDELPQAFPKSLAE